MMEFTKQLIAKYNLAADSYYTKSAYPFDWNSREVQELDALEEHLLNKWQKRIPKGWYGFSLAPCPKVWLLAIDEFLDELEKVNPNFEIHQIKCKYGSLRCYLGGDSEEEQKAIDLLESVMSDQFLIY